jgi:hypothetical protein
LRIIAREEGLDSPNASTKYERPCFGRVKRSPITSIGNLIPIRELIERIVLGGLHGQMRHL